jgi:hypothetical protein
MLIAWATWTSHTFPDQKNRRLRGFRNDKDGRAVPQPDERLPIRMLESILCLNAD